MKYCCQNSAGKVQAIDKIVQTLSQIHFSHQYKIATFASTKWDKHACINWCHSKAFRKQKNAISIQKQIILTKFLLKPYGNSHLQWVFHTDGSRRQSSCHCQKSMRHQWTWHCVSVDNTFQCKENMWPSARHQTKLQTTNIGRLRQKYRTQEHKPQLQRHFCVTDRADKHPIC